MSETGTKANEGVRRGLSSEPLWRLGTHSPLTSPARKYRFSNEKSRLTINEDQKRILPEIRTLDEAIEQLEKEQGKEAFRSKRDFYLTYRKEFKAAYSRSGYINEFSGALSFCQRVFDGIDVSSSLKLDPFNLAPEIGPRLNPLEIGIQLKPSELPVIPSAPAICLLSNYARLSEINRQSEATGLSLRTVLESVIARDDPQTASPFHALAKQLECFIAAWRSILKDYQTRMEQRQEEMRLENISRQIFRKRKAEELELKAQEIRIAEKKIAAAIELMNQRPE